MLLSFDDVKDELFFILFFGKQSSNGMDGHNESMNFVEEGEGKKTSFIGEEKKTPHHETGKERKQRFDRAQREGVH